MEENNNLQDKPVDYRVHESALARLERNNKRWFTLCVIIFAAFVLSNVAWLVYESQYEDSVTVSQDVDTQNSPAYVNGTGEMTVNGENKTGSNENKTP